MVSEWDCQMASQTSTALDCVSPENVGPLIHSRISGAPDSGFARHPQQAYIQSKQKLPGTAENNKSKWQRTQRTPLKDAHSVAELKRTMACQEGFEPPTCGLEVVWKWAVGLPDVEAQEIELPYLAPLSFFAVSLSTPFPFGFIEHTALTSYLHGKNGRFSMTCGPVIRCSG